LQGGSSVPIENLTYGEEHATMLGYPRLTRAELKERLTQLEKLGIRALEFTGEKKVSGISVMGKGCVGIVVIARVDDERAALKIRRSDADRSGMKHEAKMLRKANSVSVGPKLLGATRDFVLMQLVRGSLLPKWLEKHHSAVRVRRVLRDILEQCWLLDTVGLDHGELSHAPKHIIIDGKNKVFIVDFETASANRKPANITSVCQYLFISGALCKALEKIHRVDREALVAALRIYKRCKNRKNFETVLKECGL
jgi:putative serine/threonine protein kinase